MIKKGYKISHKYRNNVVRERVYATEKKIVSYHAKDDYWMM